MQRFVANYASAAHLAVVTVAPLFLLPFFPAAAVADSLLWLSLAALVWIVMSPSLRPGEAPHQARLRFAHSVTVDPVFWFVLVLLVFAGVRALNGGIALAYDAELLVWSVSSPAAPILPGCVTGAGRLPFAMCVAVGVVLIGVRNALGGGARASFLVASVLLSGLAAAAVMMGSVCGFADMSALMRCSYLSPAFAGTAWGVFLLMGVAATFECAEAGWIKAQLLVAAGMAGCAAGLVLFAPPATILVFAAAFALLMLAGFPLHRRVLSGAGSLPCAMAVAVAICAGAGVLFFGGAGAELASRREAVLSMKLFPDGFAEMRDILSGIAFKVWKTEPWLGSGLGSFQVDIRYMASAADWKIVSPFQTMAASGWWQILSERGVIGAAMWALGAGFLFWSYFSRMAVSVRIFRLRAAHLLCPAVAIAVAAVTFVDCSLTRADVLLPVCASLSVSAAAFPAERAGKSGDKED